MGQAPIDPSTPTTATPPGGVNVGGLRRVLAATGIVGFGILALLAIILILSDSAPGGGLGRLMGLTGALGVFSVTALGASIGFRKGLPALGWVGTVASALAFLFVAILVLGSVPDQSMAQLAILLGNLAVLTALAALLLHIRHRDTRLDTLITVTWILLGISFVFTAIQVLGGLTDGPMVRIVAAVSFLTFFGMVATPLAAIWLARGPSSATPGGIAPSGAPPVAPPESPPLQ